uniref:DNA replication licensing factor MCM4 n=1 Tax=Haptolina ericina TaxID=156174 RepID=A0A7S3B9I3_9EUKA
MEHLLARDEYAINLDCNQLRMFNEKLYNNLVSYPREMISICDFVLHDLCLELFPDRDVKSRFHVRCFNLGKENRLRDLDPNDIDKLVSIKGMVTRTSSVIPDMKMGFFECCICETPQESFADAGHLPEPQVCTNMSCQAKQSMRLIHNRSVFNDKQIIRLQEAPEHIPEGETPQTVSMCTWDALVDVSKPGDRVEITGIYRATPVRVNPRRRTVRSIYKTYVDIIHVRKLDKGRRLQAESSANDPTASAEHHVDFEEGNELASAAAERRAEYLALSQRPDLYDQLSKALAPSVWEMEDVKKGVLLQLFGGKHKQLDAEHAGSSRKRGEINVLLMGDPGTSKSQLLMYVHKVAPRGIYTSGKGSSAVGLTAYVTKDPETKEFVLESGALVLSDRGVCCIDEFDKMSDAARSILHEALEQQTVSVAKAGIICSLNARTAVLASANPINSKYDPTQSVVENINLPPTLLSRFDLIFLILDKPNETSDRKLARHLLSLYDPNRPPPPTTISQRLLMEYIGFAREQSKPELSDEAGTALIEAYVDMRKAGATKKVVSATPRQLESLIRLSEAHARMRLSDVVETDDVFEAVRLMKVAMQSAATDPTTGTIDMDLIATGRSAADRSLVGHLLNSLRERFRTMGQATLQVSDIQREIQEETGLEVEAAKLREALATLAKENVIRYLRQNTISVL